MDKVQLKTEDRERLTVYFFAVLLLCNGCFVKESESNTTKTFLKDYLFEIASSEIKGDIMLRVDQGKVDSMSLFYTRVSAQRRYLPSTIDPDSISDIGDTPVIYFLGKNLSDLERKNILEELRSKGLINDEKAYSTKTNYEEWVMLSRKGQVSYIKDAGYVPIENIIEYYY